jgi:glutamate synthase (NADPH/NADH) small chain
MTDPHAARRTPRRDTPSRPVPVRVHDWLEVVPSASSSVVQEQAGRCMDCGVPFCHHACPLGNAIPDWNDRTWRGDWRSAADQLHATNNFPEVTGRVCPAPCEAACVAGLVGDAVTIKQVERALADTSWERGWTQPRPPNRLSGRTVAVVGSGPAGLAAAQQLTRAGHTVVVFERADAAGGLLRYGIPEFKLAKAIVDRRVDQMVGEGTEFRLSVDVGRDLEVEALRRRFDAVVLAIGATRPRDLDVPGRRLGGVHQAMEYLTAATKAVLRHDVAPAITAQGKHVVVIGGGDTGSDCIGTAHRQGAASVAQLEILPEPPGQRSESTPWPLWPLMLRTSSSLEEGGERRFAMSTRRLIADGDRVSGIELVDLSAAGSASVTGDADAVLELPADLVLLAMGFVGPEQQLPESLALTMNERGAIERDAAFHSGVDGVFVAGDAGRGQSLVVWAIAEGRACAAAVDAWLCGRSTLPRPIAATDRALAP